MQSGKEEHAMMAECRKSVQSEMKILNRALLAKRADIADRALNEVRKNMEIIRSISLEVYFA